MTISEAVNNVFGDARGIVTQAATEAGVQLDESTTEQIVTALEQALAKECSECEFQQAFRESIQEMVAKETQRFMRRIGARPNGQFV